MNVVPDDECHPIDNTGSSPQVASGMGGDLGRRFTDSGGWVFSGPGSGSPTLAAPGSCKDEDIVRGETRVCRNWSAVGSFI
ncbi:hypothetical protein C8035_v009461 [Colletotrichum spinosum]|uniref:Uncharacterized protein n=1 Tax=Colletotrichum spinosum TaxID=1347390 RepID=A0A4V3HQG7_9PEZI|nr:hypothetical protein C8035_v009461 [Colletotrichum spinosum]